MRMQICAAAVLLGAAACSPTATPSRPAAGGGASRAPTAPTPTMPTLLRVVAHDFTFGGNQTVPAGLVAVRLVNEGHAIHMLGIGRLDSSRTVGDLMGALQKRTPIPYWFELGGPGTVSPGDSVTAYLTLEPGTYSTICWMPDSTGKGHETDGMFATLTVTGDSAGAPVPPTPDLYVRERDYHISLSQTPTAGRHVLAIDNDGPQNHDLAILRLLPGKTEEQALAWLAHPTMSDAPVEAVGGIVGQERWAHAEVAVDLVPGDYLFLCMIPDAKDGKPHFMHGMVTRVKVT